MAENDNTWISGERPGQADAYLSVADLIIIEWRRTFKLLGDLFAHHFGAPRRLDLLDLGCGDGVLSRYLDHRYREIASSSSTARPR